MANLKKQDLKERLDLLITTIEPVIRMTKPPNPMDNGVIIHFAESIYNSVSGSILYREIILISIELFRGISWGPYSVGSGRVEARHDLSDLIHQRGYCRKILWPNNSFTEEHEKVWQDVERTSFIQSMSIDAWERTWWLLNKIRSLRIQNRIKEPRTKSWQKFDEDELDQALAKIIIRVNAMLNGVLFWGQVKEGLKLNFLTTGIEP